jgi:hypothetical protein
LSEPEFRERSLTRTKHGCWDRYLSRWFQSVGKVSEISTFCQRQLRKQIKISFETSFLLTRLCSRDIFYLYVQLHVYAVGDINFLIVFIILSFFLPLLLLLASCLLSRDIYRVEPTTGHLSSIRVNWSNHIFFISSMSRLSCHYRSTPRYHGVVLNVCPVLTHWWRSRDVSSELSVLDQLRDIRDLSSHTIRLHTYAVGGIFS